MRKKYFFPLSNWSCDGASEWRRLQFQSYSHAFQHLHCSWICWHHFSYDWWISCSFFHDRCPRETAQLPPCNWSSCTERFLIQDRIFPWVHLWKKPPRGPIPLSLRKSFQNLAWKDFFRNRSIIFYYITIIFSWKHKQKFPLQNSWSPKELKMLHSHMHLHKNLWAPDFSGLRGLKCTPTGLVGTFYPSFISHWFRNLHFFLTSYTALLSLR